MSSGLTYIEPITTAGNTRGVVFHAARGDRAVRISGKVDNERPDDVDRIAAGVIADFERDSPKAARHIQMRVQSMSQRDATLTIEALAEMIAEAIQVKE
jgi:hypothetical protein